MSEQAPKNPRLENLDRDWEEVEKQRAEADQEEFENAIYGDLNEMSSKEEARQRIEEADEYERHMQMLAERDENYTPLNDVENQPSPAYDAEVEEAHALNDALNAAEAEVIEANRKAVNDKINNSASLRRMDAIAADIKRMREDNVDAHRIQSREDALNELLAQYEATDDYDAVVADELIERTTPESEAPEADPETDSDTGNDSDSENDDPSEKDSKKPAFDDEAVLNEAYAEYEEREGAEYDVDKGREKDVAAAEAAAHAEYEERLDETRVQDKDAAHAAALEEDKERVLDEAYAEYEEREGQPYDVDKDRIKTVDLAEEMAYKEAEERDTPTQLDDGTDESKLRRLWNRMNAKAATGYSAARERWSGLSNREKIGRTAIGIGVLAVGAAILYKATGHNLFENQPDGGGATPGIGDGADGGVGNGGANVPNGPEAGNNDFGGTNPVELPGGNIDAARNVTAGEGWYQTLQEIGFSKEEMTQEFLDKIRNASGELGNWTYTMSDGLPGISKPGTLPDSVIEQIKSLR